MVPNGCGASNNCGEISAGRTGSISVAVAVKERLPEVSGGSIMIHPTAPGTCSSMPIKALLARPRWLPLTNENCL